MWLSFTFGEEKMKTMRDVRLYLKGRRIRILDILLGALVGLVIERIPRIFSFLYSACSPELLRTLLPLLSLLLLILLAAFVFLLDRLFVCTRFIRKHHGLVDPDKEEWSEEVFNEECKKLEREEQSSEPSDAASGYRR